MIPSVFTWRWSDSSPGDAGESANDDTSADKTAADTKKDAGEYKDDDPGAGVEITNEDAVESTRDEPAAADIKPDPSRYKKDADGNLIVISDEYKLDPIYIRQLNDRNNPRAGNVKGRSHIVISISGHGEFLPDDLPADLRDNVLTWTVTSPNSQSASRYVSIKDEKVQYDGHFLNVIPMYAKYLLHKNYPILNVLNQMRQLFTRKHTSVNKFYGNADSIDGVETTSFDDSIREHLDYMNETFNNMLKTPTYHFLSPYSDDTNIVYDDMTLVEISKHMLNKNKFAYMYLPTRDKKYNQTVLSKNYLEYIFPNLAHIEPVNITLSIDVLDVRFPTRQSQLDLRTPKGNKDFESKVTQMSRTSQDRLEVHSTTTTGDILTYLKKECGFDYVTIIDMSCNVAEFELNPSYSLPDYDTMPAPLPNAIAQTEQYYSKQRNDVVRYLKKTNFKNFGGSVRGRRRRKSKRATRRSRRRRTGKTKYTPMIYGSRRRS
jgi:hypothetical protein